MDLKDFVAQTLTDILDGIKHAQSREDVGGLVAPSNIGGHQFPSNTLVSYAANIMSTVVQFDIAVTAEESGNAGGKGSIKVLVASLDGALQYAQKNTNASRVQFAVPLIFPKNNRVWHSS